MGFVLKVDGLDNRGTEDVPYGFVYFNDGMRVTFANKNAGSGSGGWGAVTQTHIRLANEYLNRPETPAGQ